MILSKKTTHFFLSQANLVSWDLKNDCKIKQLKGRNNNIYFKNGTNNFLLKQSLSEVNSLQEGIIQESFFYSWLQKQEDFPDNFISFVGFEPKNCVAIFKFQQNSKSLKFKQLTDSVLNGLCSLLFCFHGVKWKNVFPTIIKDKPDIWKLIYEEPTIHKLPNQWFEIRDFIKTRPILLQALNELLIYWKPKFICNNDIKLDNFLIDKHTKKIYWIDWERFCLADELWDSGELLRLIFFEHLKIRKNLDIVLEDSLFQSQISLIWRKVSSINADISKDKLLLIWMAAILEKTLELVQEGSINIKTAYFLVIICEEIQINCNIIKELIN